MSASGWGRDFIVWESGREVDGRACDGLWERVCWQKRASLLLT